MPPGADYMTGMDTMIEPRQTLSTDQTTTHTVLVVDDELMVRMPIAEFLRDCGYAVIEASNASEAMAMIDAEAVELVFSDVRMPGSMDGLGLARWLRTTHPEIPVILTSGYIGGRAGPDSVPGVRFIPKPYSQANVAERIAALINDD
jgi:CheY-like chemotaxis protein